MDLMVYDPGTQKKVTIDVKGLKNTTDWIMPNNPCQGSDHFYVLVTFKNKFGDLEEIPEVYTLPSEQITKLCACWLEEKKLKQ